MSSSLSAYLTIEAKDGTEKKVHKACALMVLFQGINNEKGSTDWQKHIQGLAHYSVKPSQLVHWMVLAMTQFLVKAFALPILLSLLSLKLSAVDVQQALISMLPEDNIVIGFHILTLKSVAVCCRQDNDNGPL